MPATLLTLFTTLKSYRSINRNMDDIKMHTTSVTNHNFNSSVMCNDRNLT